METLQKATSSKGWFTSERLPLLKMSPIVTPEKLLTRAFDLCDMFMNASAEVKLPAHSFGQKEKSRPVPASSPSKDAGSVNSIFLLQHENGNPNNNDLNNHNNKGTYAAGKLK